MTVGEIAKLVTGTVVGDATRTITGAAGLHEADANQLSFLKDPKKQPLLNGSNAGAILVGQDVLSPKHTLIQVHNPQAAFAVFLGKIADEKSKKKGGIHPLASVASSAKLGQNVSIGPFCVIEDDAVIEDGAQLISHVYVGLRSKIGAQTVLYPQVVLREDVNIGARCVIHAGAIIGSDGYGFYFANGKHNKIPQIGTVLIEDDVEIGSCTTIDRATTGITRIRTGAKIDNLVQIAHNVDVGPHSLLVAQVGIAGSTKLGTGVVLAGQVGVADHLEIGDGVQVGAQSGLKDNVPAGSVMFGSPAQPIQDTLKQMLLVRKLPELFSEVKKLKGQRTSGS